MIKQRQFPLPFYHKAGRVQRQTNFFLILALASELGFSIALPIVGGIIIGSFFDSKLRTQPAFTLVLLVVGVMIGMYNFFIAVRRGMEKFK